MKQFLLKMSRSTLLISTLLHVAAFCSIYRSKMSSSAPVEAITIVIREVSINRGVKVTTLPQLRKLLPHFNSPGVGGSQSATDMDEEISKALEEMEEGNPFRKKEHKFFSYYERIKQDVEPLWVAGVMDLAVTSRRQKSKWRISGGKVATIVTLIDKNGTVRESILVKTSGDPRLDALAVSLMRGRRYPNPPKDLIESDGYGRLVWYYRT